MGRHRFPPVLVAIPIALLAAGEAWACPACYGGNEGPLLSYFLTGLLLSLLPLGLITGIAVWFYRQTRPSRAERAPWTATEPDAAGRMPEGVPAAPPAPHPRPWSRESTTPVTQEGAPA